MAKAVTDCGFPGYTMHGVRYRAAKNLLEHGCSENEVMNITGHKTTAMVQKYGREASQRRLALSAIHKIDRGNRGNKKG